MEEITPLSECRFVRVAGMKLVFEPGDNSHNSGKKKHGCSDCHFCQFCSDSRCLSCRGGKNRSHGSPCRKLSLREQILLYEANNSRS